MKIHQVLCTEPGTIRQRDLSCVCTFSQDEILCKCYDPKTFEYEKVVNTTHGTPLSGTSSPNCHEHISNATPVQISTRDFLAAIYDNKYYVGQVCEIDVNDGEACIDFMKMCGTTHELKWPQKK